MPSSKLNRPYRERFLDNFDRSRLRREVEAVRPLRPKGRKTRVASWALGASLALGGIGTPLTMIGYSESDIRRELAGTRAVDLALERDLLAASSIAVEVAGGVSAVVGDAPRQLSLISEKVREEFFRTEVPFGSIIYSEAKRNNLRPELVAAVVEAESRFKPTARSGAGAVGLMQLVPRTGRWMGARDLTNPSQNISAGTKYLKYLNERFDGNETKVIAAYNAGEGNVKRFDGVPPFVETRDYVQRVRDYEREYHSRVENRRVEIDDPNSPAEPLAEAR